MRRVERAAKETDLCAGHGGGTSLFDVSERQKEAADIHPPPGCIELVGLLFYGKSSKLTITKPLALIVTFFNIP